MSDRHILFVHSGDNWIRGSERVLLDMIDALPRDKYRVTVCCRDSAHALIKELSSREIITYPMPLHSLMLYGGHNLFRFLGTAWRIYKLARTSGADLIHASSGLSIQYCHAASLLLRIPSIAHVQGIYLRSSRTMSLLSKATLQLFVSEAVAKPYKSVRQKTIFYGGIDTVRFAPSTHHRQRARSELGIKPSSMVVGFVGSLEERKRAGFFLQMAAMLKQSVPDLRFVIVGDGPLARTITHQRSDLELEHDVLLLQERSDIEVLMNAFDVLVCPSRSEAFGLVAAEAGSVGLPVVASDIDGLPEIVQDDETGYLCSPDDLEAFIARTRQLLSDPALRARLGANARQRICAQFSKRRFAQRLQDIYADLFYRVPGKR